MVEAKTLENPRQPLALQWRVATPALLPASVRDYFWSQNVPPIRETVQYLPLDPLYAPL